MEQPPVTQPTFEDLTAIYDLASRGVPITYEEASGTDLARVAAAAIMKHHDAILGTDMYVQETLRNYARPEAEYDPLIAAEAAFDAQALWELGVFELEDVVIAHDRAIELGAYARDLYDPTQDDQYLAISEKLASTRHLLIVTDLLCAYNSPVALEQMNAGYQCYTDLLLDVYDNFTVSAGRVYDDIKLLNSLALDAGLDLTDRLVPLLEKMAERSLTDGSEDSLVAGLSALADLVEFRPDNKQYKKMVKLLRRSRFFEDLVTNKQVSPAVSEAYERIGAFTRLNLYDIKYMFKDTTYEDVTV
ncbi:hypothetical protein KA047_00545 [Candidatus Saccharibacteria bacterium]|nr:hypothetical protein [Candidatus Saccharibacteria bacterium]